MFTTDLSQIRRLIGDFGVPIAIFVMIAIDISISDAYTQVGVVWNEVLPNIIYDMFLFPLGSFFFFPDNLKQHLVPV